MLGGAAFVLAGAAGPTRAEPDGGYAKHVRSFLEIRQERVVMQEWDISCGAAALATILAFQYSDPIPERDIAMAMLRATDTELVKQRLGFSLLDLKRFLESRGYAGDGYGDVGLADLVALAPAIVPIKLQAFDHFVVFRGLAAGRVVLADSAYGNRTMLVPHFLEVWRKQIAFVVRRPEQPPQENLLALEDAALLVVPSLVVRAAIR
jgi:predicted double-glycine peptidase